VKRQEASASGSADVELTHKPVAYGIPAEKIDGMDVLAVLRACRYAAEAVRDGSGPRFLELATYRFRAHSMYDAERYRSKEEVVEWKKRDPIELWAGRLRERALLTDSQRDAIEQESAREVAAAVAEAEQGPWEPEGDLHRFVYAEKTP
jgi:pyruvate dehydrogenase E1 component alpha subunit